MALLTDVKDALRVTKSEFEPQLNLLINAAVQDLNIAGIQVTALGADALTKTAIITYCYMHFYRDFTLKASYDEQKAQLISATGYGLEAEEAVT